MRRYLSLLVLGLLLAATPVLAQGVVTVGNVSAQPGATVNVAVTVSDIPQIGGVSLGIRVQAPAGAPALQFGEAIRGTVFQGPRDVIATDLATPGQVQVVALSPEATAGPGTLFLLPVTVSSQAAPGTVYQLQVSKVEVVDATNNPVAVRAFGGTVAVAEPKASVLSVANVTGAPGQTVSVPVNISAGVVGLGGASVTLSMIGLTAAGDAVRGPLFSGPNDVVATNVPAPGVVQVVAISPTTVSGPGTIFSIPVAIPKTAKPGQVFPVVIREAELVDGANNPLAVVRQDGSVTVVSLAVATISVGITPAQPGSVAMIRVTANADVRDLAALRVTLDLGGGLTAVGDATLAGSLFAGPNDQIGTDRSNPSRPQVIIVTPGAVNGPGVLFSIPVQVPADAKPGTVLPVQIAYAEALNSNNEPIEVIVQHGGVLVQAVDQFIRVDPREVLPGEVFPLSVSIGAGVANLGGVRATLNLGGLTAVGDAAIEGTLFAGVPNTLIATSRVDAGRPQVILVSAGAVSGPGVVFTIPVKVPDTAVAGQEFLVLLEGLEAVDMNNQLIPLLVAPDSGRIRVKEQIPGIVSVVSITGVNPGATVNLQIAANEQVKDLAGASFALDLGGLTATGKATLEGGIFAGIPNTQIETDLSVPGAPRVLIVSPGAANGPGTVFTIPVKVPEGALPGTQFLIRLSIIEAINHLNQPLPLLARDGTITVGQIPPPLPGLVIIRDASGAPGATIPLTVDIENLVNVGGARVNLNLGGLTAVGEATSTLFSGPNDIVRTDLTNPGAPQVILLTPGGKNAPATLFTIPVQIPATATEGQKFTVTATVEFIDVANNPLAVNVQPGTVTVVGAPPVGVVKVRDMEVDPDSVATLVVEADGNVKGLGALKMVLDLGPLSAAGDATLAGSLFEKVANTQVGTDRTNANRPQVIVVSPGAVEGPGVLFSLPIRVPADQAGKEVTVSVAASEFIGANNEALVVEVRGGVVRVRPLVPPPAKVVEIEVGSAEGAPGSTVELPISLSAASKDIGAGRIVFEVGRLTAGTAKKGALLGAEDQISTNVVGSQVDVAVVAAKSVNGPGELMVLPLTIPADAKDGEQFPVKVVRAEFIDVNNQPIPEVRWKDGLVTAKVVAPPVAANVVSVNVIPVKPGPDPSGPVVIRVDNAQSMAALDLTVTYKASLGKFDPASVKLAEIALDPQAVVRADDTEVAGNPELRQLRVVIVHPKTFTEGGSGAVATINFIGATDLKPLDSSLLTPVKVTMANAQNVESDITATARPGGLIAGAQWTYDIRPIIGVTGVVGSSVSTIGNTVYFGDSQGRVYALNASTGVPVFAQPADLGANAGAIVGRPTVKSDAVYVVTSNGRVAKIAAAGAPGAGTVLWNVAALPGGPAPNATAAVQTDATGKLFVFVPDAGGRIHKLDAQTGAEVAVSQDLTPGTEMVTSPSVGLLGLEAPFNFDLWVGAGRNIYRLNADDLTTRGTEFPIAVSDELISPPFVTPLLTREGADRGVVFASKDGKVYVLSATTGKFIGNSPYDAKAPVTGATFVTVDANGLPNTVYVPAQDGSVHAVDLKTVQGAPLVTGLQGNLSQALIAGAKTATDVSYVYAPAAVDNNTVLHVVSVGDPTKRYAVIIPGKPSAPAMSRAAAAGEVSVVVVTTDTGAVVAIPLQ